MKIIISIIILTLLVITGYSNNTYNQDSTLTFYLTSWNENSSINKYENINDYFDSHLKKIDIKDKKYLIPRFDKLELAIDTLFILKHKSLLGKSCYNSLTFSDLKLDSIAKNSDKIMIYISGSLIGIGSQADPILKRQLEKTIEYYVNDYDIILNSKSENWKCALLTCDDCCP